MLNNPLSASKYKAMIAQMKNMVAVLNNNGLISDDAAQSSDTSAKMFSSALHLVLYISTLRQIKLVVTLWHIAQFK